jgi:cation diffusion facilitator CzcD-associated flavoprotein CzcO
MGRHEAAVIGAGPAGLAAAAMLTRSGINTVVLEQADDVGSSWSAHYVRLHLHTVRWLSGLPGPSIAQLRNVSWKRRGTPAVTGEQSYPRV